MADSDRTSDIEALEEQWQQQMRLHSQGDVTLLAQQQQQQQAQQPSFSDEPHQKK